MHKRVFVAFFIIIYSSHIVYIAPSPPADVSVSQSGVNSVLVSWSSPSGEPAVTGFIIYYQHFGRERLSQSVGSTANNATITGLIAGSYFITMVATSSTLPSAETAVESIALGIMLHEGIHFKSITIFQVLTSIPQVI